MQEFNLFFNQILWFSFILDLLKKFFLHTLTNLQDIELNGLIDKNDDEIPLIEILKLIKVNKLPNLRRFKCNNRVYIPDNTPNINFNSEQAKHSGLRPLSNIKNPLCVKYKCATIIIVSKKTLYVNKLSIIMNQNCKNYTKIRNRERTN